MSFEPLVQVDFCGVEMSTNAPSADGAVWFCSGLDGWDSADIRDASVDPTSSHGTIQAAAFYQGRRLTLLGSVLADTPESAWAAHRRVTGAMPPIGSSAQLLVHEDIDLWLMVRLNGRIVAPSPKSRAFTFEVPLITDGLPFKRQGLSAVTTTIAPGDTENLTNNGTASAYLTVEANSSGTVQVKQMDSGQVLKSKTTVASGTTFDGASKRVTTSGGTVLFGVLDNPSEWLSIPRLDTVGVKNEGTAPVDVTYYHAYA